MQAARALSALGQRSGGGGGHGHSHGGGHGHSHGGGGGHGHSHGGQAVKDSATFKTWAEVDVMPDDQPGQRSCVPPTPPFEAIENLEQACEGGLLSLVIAQLAVGVSPSRTDPQIAATPLHWAAFKGRLAVVKLLLDQPGVDVNARDNRGQTALMWSLTENHIEVASFLVERGADPSIPDNRDVDCYSVAAQRGLLPMLYLLHSSKPMDPQTEDVDGHNTIVWAAFKGHLGVLQYLKEVIGVDHTTKDDNGRNALHWAAREGHTDVILYLTALGLDPHERDNEGVTAYQWTIRHNHYGARFALARGLKGPQTKVYGTLQGLLDFSMYNWWFHLMFVIAAVAVPLYYFVLARWLVPYMAFFGLVGYACKNYAILVSKPTIVQNSVPPKSLAQQMAGPQTPDELFRGLPEMNYRDPGFILAWMLVLVMEYGALPTVGVEPPPILLALGGTAVLALFLLKQNAFADIIPAGNVKDDPVFGAVDRRELADVRWRRIYNTKLHVHVPVRAFHCKEYDAIIREYNGWCLMADAPLSASNRRSYGVLLLSMFLFQIVVLYEGWTAMTKQHCPSSNLPDMPVMLWNLFFSSMPCKAGVPENTWFHFLLNSPANRDAQVVVALPLVVAIMLGVLGFNEFVAAAYGVTQIERWHGTMPSKDGGLTSMLRGGRSIFSAPSLVDNCVAYLRGTQGTQWRDVYAIPAAQSTQKRAVPQKSTCCG